MTMPKHLLRLSDLSTDTFRALIKRAIELKDMKSRGDIYEPLKNRVLAMIFEKSSTRTRVSFESGMTQFGGHAIFLSPRDCQLGRGEPVEDTARVLSGMVDAVMLRTFHHEYQVRFAAYSRVPVINGLSDQHHPCQLLADMQTYFEGRGDIAGRSVAWIGDGNNMCYSYMEAAKVLDFQLRIACPEGYGPDKALLAEAGDHVVVCDHPKEAVDGTHLVTTDVWASMGQEEEASQRRQAFKDYQVNEALMSLADKDALFMHCLPAHRGEEVSHGVIDGPQSIVWTEAENRLHAQKALLEWIFGAHP